jgi:hypothetical protein
MALSAPPRATTFTGANRPHSVDKPDKALLIATGREVVVGEGAQQHVRRAHDEISVNGLPVRELVGDALKAIVTALGVDGGA